MSAPRAFRWHDGRAVDDDGAPARSVHVADSWLVRGGRTLALPAHFERFWGGVHDAAPGIEPELERFWAEMLARVPAEGEWSPRVELVELRDDERKVLRGHLRPAPPRSPSARLVTATHDPRTRPRVKGPDLVALGQLSDEARPQGADEAVIVDDDGIVVEGAYSSLGWWRGDTLCVVADEVPRLAGVTERSLVTLASALGVDVVHEVVGPDDLDGLEVWVLNSLHGLRIATAWHDGPSLAEEPGRLRTWRSRLERLERPLV